MKRALRGALRGSSPSTRGRRPPPPPLASAPDASSRRTIVSVGNQLSRFSQQRQRPLLQQQQRQQGQQQQRPWQRVFSSKDVGRDLGLAPPMQQGFVAGAGSTRGRERGRGSGRGDGGTRFGPRSRSAAVATAAAAAVAAAVAAAAGGKQADCDYPEGTRFGDVYYCSGKALGSGEWKPFVLSREGCTSTEYQGVVGRDVPGRRVV